MGRSDHHFKTVLKTPYFFNFHDQDLGHTVVLGPEGTGKTTLINFFLSEARKYNNKIFYFDYQESSKPFIEALSGNYHVLTKDINDHKFLQLNPFSLPKNAENSAFLSAWIKELVIFLKGEVPEEEMALIPQVVEQTLASPNPSFLVAFDIFANTAPALYEKLKIWGSGKLAYVFGSQNEGDWRNQVHAFDLAEIINQKPVLIPVVSYLMQRIEASLDGVTPAIVVFDEAWELLDNTVIAPKLNDFLERLRRKNCVAIFVSRNREEIAESPITKVIKENTATQIYLADKDPGEYCKTIFELSDEEFDILEMMDVKDRNFLLKNRGDSVIIDLDLSGLGEVLKILSADTVTIAAMEEIIAGEKEKDPNKIIAPKDWIPQLVDVIKEIEKEKRDELIKAAREEKKAQMKENEEA